MIFCKKYHTFCPNIFGATVYEAYNAQQGADHPVGMHEMGHYSTVCQNRNRHVTTFFKKQRQQKKQDDAFFKRRKHRHPPYQKSSVVENLRTYITHIYYLKT